MAAASSAMPWTGRLSQGRSAEGHTRPKHGHSPSDGSVLRRSHNSRMSQALATSSGSSSLSIHLPQGSTSSNTQQKSAFEPGTPPSQSNEFSHTNAADGLLHSPRSANVPLTPSSIHPSYGVEHAKHAKYISTAYQGCSQHQHQHQPQASLGSGSPPMSAPAHLPNFPFDESKLHSYSGGQQPWQNEMDTRPLTSPRLLSPRMASHSPYADNDKDRDHKEKQRSCSLPKHSPHLAAEHQRRQPRAYLAGLVPAGSPLGTWIDSCSSPGSNRLLDSPAAWIFYYFVLNLGLTLYNKIVLVKFPFPFTVTGIHCLCGAAGGFLLQRQGAFIPASLSTREYSVLIAFSFLYTSNIACSNVSLSMVTVPFHQVVRATTPMFTLLLNYLFLNKNAPTSVYVSLIPVVAGVGLATYGDYYCTVLGFVLTSLGAFLAAVKGIATNLLLVGRLRLHPLDLLFRMSPLAFAQCVIYAWCGGELQRVQEYSATKMTRSSFIALVFNGVFAFALNVVSFSANKKTSALTMTVAANVKQVLTILWAVWLFDVVLNFTNSLGIFLTLVGGAAYAFANHTSKRDIQKAKIAESGLSPQLEISMPASEKR